MKRIGYALGIGLLLVAGAGRAHATLIGDTIDADYQDPKGTIQFGPVSAVANGTQILALEHTLITVTAGQIIFNFTNGWGFPSNPFSGIVVFDQTHAFTSASFASSNFSLPASDVTFSGGSVYLNLAGLSGPNTDQVTVNASTIPITVPTPEPTSIGILGIGVLSLGLLRRRAA